MDKPKHNTNESLDAQEKEALRYVLESYLSLNEEDIDDEEWVYLNQIYEKLQ